MSESIKVAEITDLQPGECKTVQAGDRELALANVDGKFFACDNVCPHQGGPLGEGNLDGTVITCPWHGWKFDVCSGKSSVIPGMEIDAYECTVDGNDVTVTL